MHTCHHYYLTCQLVPSHHHPGTTRARAPMSQLSNSNFSFWVSSYLNFSGPLTLQPTPSSSKARPLCPITLHYCVPLKPALPHLSPLCTSQFMPPLISVKPKLHLSPFVLTPWIISSNPAMSTMPFIQVSSMSPIQPRPRPWTKGLAT